MNSVQNAAKDASYQTYVRKLTALVAWDRQTGANAPSVSNPEVGPAGAPVSAQLITDLKIGSCLCTNPG
jgi:hypothetical protein